MRPALLIMIEECTTYLKTILIYGKKPKAKEWNQIKQFIQSNRTAIQRHWSQETDSIGLFKELTHNC